MKRALVSVSDKTGLIDFLKPLVKEGLKVISTGGTLKFLQQNEISATDISYVTGFPEVLDGRVKTLHPFIHMGLLADISNEAHQEQLKLHAVESFDLVIGNLYPFEQAALIENATESELIEKIDIGGPSFLRSSAKNYKSVVVICDPADYSWVQTKILDNNFELHDRRHLAMKVFSLTSYYDALIVQRLSATTDTFKYLNIPFKKKSVLRYGENAHQSAIWYENPLEKKNLAHAQIHQGKDLSFNNILDLDASADLVQLYQNPSCVAVKHNNPCAAASAKTLTEALAKVIESDPKSIFGAILAFNKEVDLECCHLMKPLFLECLIAPSYSDSALAYLKAKKNLRVLSWPELNNLNLKNNLKSVSGGILEQATDSFAEKNWQTYGTAVTPEIKQDMIFGEKICGFLKSNAIALVYQGQTVGLGMGQVNRVDAVQQAFSRLREFRTRHEVNLEKVVLISDAFFPFADSIDFIAQEKIKWVLQPGGSMKDEEVIAAAQRNKISMTLTFQRHFRH